MNISKTDFKILYNNISSLSRNDINNIVTDINQNNVSHPVISDLLTKYSSDDITSVINKVSNKILFGGAEKDNNILTNLVSSLPSNDLTKYGYKF